MEGKVGGELEVEKVGGTEESAGMGGGTGGPNVTGRGRIDDVSRRGTGLTGLGRRGERPVTGVALVERGWLVERMERYRGCACFSRRRFGKEGEG